MNYLKNLRRKIVAFSQLHFDRLINFSIVALFLLFLPYPNVYFKNIVQDANIFKPKNVFLPKPPPYPVNQRISELPKISAMGVYVLDTPSNVVIYEKNSQEKFFPASTTKIMTALVGLDHYQLEDILTVKTVITEPRRMGLVNGEKISFEALLYGSLVHSANDAAYTIAENYPGGTANFVAMMNKKAASLNLSDTHFSNPIGFDDEDQYITARDLAKLTKIAMHNKIFAKIVSTKSITVSDVTYTYFHPLSNVNELLGKISGVSGVKTGFTQTAGEVLVSEVKKNDREVIFVVMKSQDRFGESEKLINWVFENFAWKPIDEINPATGYQLLEDRQQNYYHPQKQI